jgi:tight adherence protein C
MGLDIAAIDTQLLMVGLGVVAAVLGGFLALYGFFIFFKKKNRVADRIDTFVVPEAEEPEGNAGRTILMREVSGSLFRRTVVNWLEKLGRFLGRFTPVSMAVTTEHKLEMAGYPGNMHAPGFFALRFLMILVGFALAYLLNRDPQNMDMTSLLMGGGVLLICFLFPNVWLNGKIRARQDEASRALPDALDMLSVCASAGLGFDQSLQKISGYWDNELGREFRRAIEEMEMGISRAVALKNMSSRLEVNELTQFISILIQAEKIGMSYADVLHSQALQMRTLRQQRAREIANKLPAKMLIPLVIFIFPAILAVIIGPIIPELFGIF